MAKAGTLVEQSPQSNLIASVNHAIYFWNHSPSHLVIIIIKQIKTPIVIKRLYLKYPLSIIFNS